ncbi:50S ribosomal protein L3, partial [Striga asiatica]
SSGIRRRSPVIWGELQKESRAHIHQDGSLGYILPVFGPVDLKNLADFPEKWFVNCKMSRSPKVIEVAKNPMLSWDLGAELSVDSLTFSQQIEYAAISIAQGLVVLVHAHEGVKKYMKEANPVIDEHKVCVETICSLKICNNSQFRKPRRRGPSRIDGNLGGMVTTVSGLRLKPRRRGPSRIDQEIISHFGLMATCDREEELGHMGQVCKIEFEGIKM